MERGESDHALQGVSTTFKIFRAVQDTDSKNLTGLASHLGLAKSTVYRHLETLRENGYVRREPDGYKVGYRVLHLAHQVKRDTTGFETVRRLIEDLWSEINMPTDFSVLERDRGLVVYEQQHESRWEERSTGKYHHLHNTASGKAMLSTLSVEAVRDIAETHGLPRTTPQTCTTISGLLDELDQTRKRGYAVNDEEWLSGFRSVGVPLSDTDGNLVGSLTVSGPSYQMELRQIHQQLAPLLRERSEQFPQLLADSSESDET